MKRKKTRILADPEYSEPPFNRSVGGDSLTPTEGNPTRKKSGSGGPGKLSNSRNRKKYVKLRRLSEWSVIHDKVCAGVNIERIAAWIQEECHQLSDTKRPALVRMLYDYKRSIPTQLVKPVELAKIDAVLESKLREIDVIDEANKLYTLQKDRLGRMLDMDSASPIGIYPEMSKELDRAMRYLKDIKALQGAPEPTKTPKGMILSDPTSDEAMELRQGIMHTLREKHGPEAESMITDIGRKLHAEIKRIQATTIATVATEPTEPDFEILSDSIEGHNEPAG